MIDDPAIDFLGYAIVVATIPRLHMKNRNSTAGCCDCRKGAIRITENQNFVRLVLGKNFVRFPENLTYLLAEAVSTDTEMNVWCADLEIADKNIAKTLVIVLSGMDRDVIAVLIEDLDHQAKPDYFGTRPEDRHDLHILFYLPAARKYLISSLAEARSSRSSATEMLSSFEEYSVVSACLNSLPSRSSGSTGCIT